MFFGANVGAGVGAGVVVLQKSQFVTQDPTQKQQYHGQLGGGSFINTPSMMWTTPFVALLSADITLSPFTVTAPLLALIETVLPSTVSTSWDASKSVEKPVQGAHGRSKRAR